MEITPPTMPNRPVKTGHLKLEISETGNHFSEASDGVLFRQALERQTNALANEPEQPGVKRPSLGDKMSALAVDVASEVKKDQQYVSKLLEQASRTGDSMQLMKAMMALNDYQIRVQTISKTVAKATSALEQLTKLQ